jgi:hypothetical protein
MVYLVGTADDGSPFIAMEYIPGGSLEGMIVERTAVPFSRVADLMIQCCEGLGAAYKKSIIHRDIKPGNIMLDAEGTVKIVDFGLAKVFHEDSYRTVAGMVMGTPRYMAPEQSQGREVDYRADMYSLGATFYHLVVGKPPFDGPNPTQIMMKHVTAPLVPARNINPEVPIEFDDVLRRCMAKEPSSRYLDYSDLVADLGRIKLQYLAKERGSLVTGMGDMPTMRVGPGGMPVAPGGPARRGDKSLIGQALAAEAAEEAVIPIWRYFAMGTGALMVLLAIAFAILLSARPSTSPAEQQASGTAPTGLKILVDRLAAQASSDAPTAPPPDSDYLAYLATREIVEELGRAMFTFSVEKGRQADSIIELARSGAAVEIYDTSARGVPLDGWGRPLDYARGQQVIVSMGLDGRPSTPDDIRCDAEGALSIASTATYDALEERERTRTARR